MRQYAPQTARYRLHKFLFNLIAFVFLLIVAAVGLTAGDSVSAGATGTTAPGVVPQTSAKAYMPGPFVLSGRSGPSESARPSAPACGPDWTVVPSPDPGVHNILFGVAVTSPNDVWAVGTYYTNSSNFQTLVEHWDGTAWSIVSSPNQGSRDNFLYKVAVASANNMWAVGYYTNNSNGDEKTLVEHWDGAAWSIISSPSPGPTGSNAHLYSVSVASANDVWAVGAYLNDTQTLVEHWDGAAWNIVSSPNPGSSDTLYGVAVVSANDVWTVGTYYDNNSHVYETLAEHWNGSAWSVVASPNQGSGANLLNNVAVTSANDVWAVGYYLDTVSNKHRTLIERWNGIAWTIVPSPNPGPSDTFLSGVAVASANDVWAVGFYFSGAVRQTLVEHWNGSTWGIVSSPNPGSGDNSLSEIAVASANDVWAVGDYFTSPVNHTLIERFNPCSITVTPTAIATATTMPTSTSTSTNTPAPTQTPGGPTATPPPTDTPTPTACPIQFTDVPEGSTFYPYIHCLACRGIVSGYTTDPPCTTGTPCFQPYSNVTRGQLAKFISNAANYQDNIPQTQQTFTDVPYGSPFWLFIERAYLHNVISGYTTNPPCTTGTPCFLPYNDVTRGQTAKFVSNSINYQDNIPQTQQTFTDVPNPNPFWLYVERVYLHNVISGYSTNPPCSTGTPCFLPFNSVTRGQTAKFISNAFFPNCQTLR